MYNSDKKERIGHSPRKKASQFFSIKTRKETRHNFFKSESKMQLFLGTLQQK